MAESNSKRRKALEEDKINSLPDDVLNHILSCLPTKTAVATSCLSHRWQRLWQHLHVLDFFYDDSLYSDNPVELRKFVFLVNGVLALLRNPRSIRKMCLHCAHSVINDYNFHVHSLDNWVCPVIGPYLEELDLDLFIDDENAPDFKLPLSLFTSLTLFH